MKPVLGILLGEATGIGPELIAKLCAGDKLFPYCRPILIGDLRVLKMGQKIAGVDFPVRVIEDASGASWDGPFPILDLKNLDPDTVQLGRMDPVSGKITGDTLVTALNLCGKGVIAGFMYGPLHKAAIQLGGYDFRDEQKLMAHYLNWNGPCGEINVVDNLWTSRVTSHIPINSISGQLSMEKTLDAIRLINKTVHLSGVETPRVAVAGLNPHNGEEGLCGREEIDVIAPAVEKARAEGIKALGPYSADTIFINAFKGEYDAVVTMYHDQGQIAIKLMKFQYGVTVGGGLPYAITTPAHGTAFDIAGKGIADPTASERALMIAAKMAGWRGQEGKSG